jgi:hypothetical protein
MIGDIFKAIIPTMIGSLAGGASGAGQNQAAGMNTSLQPNQGGGGTPPFNGAEFGKGLMSSVGDIVGSTARHAIESKLRAKIDGKARKDFNDEAFPGTAPWEQLGSGGEFTQGMTEGLQLKQREKESQRAADTQLAQARIQASQAVGGQLIEQGGVTALPTVLDLMARSGAFPAGEGFDPDAFSRLKADAEIARTDAQTAESKSRSALNWSMVDKTIAQKNLDEQALHLNVVKSSIEAFDKLYGGHLSREFRSGWQLLVNDIILGGSFRSEDPGDALLHGVIRHIEEATGKGPEFEAIIEEEMKKQSSGPKSGLGGRKR